jgi:hypothetical protein
MTTNRSLSWIDHGRFADLLAQVTETPRAHPSPAPVPVRPAKSAPVKPSVTPPAPRVARAPVAAAGPVVPAVPAAVPIPPAPLPPAAMPVPPPLAPLQMAPPPPPIKSYPPFSSAARNLEDRLQALVAWIELCVPCHAAFIADDNGLPVVEHIGADPGQIAAASSILLMLASVRTLVRDSGGWLSLKLGAAILNVVEVATQWGRFGIGIVTDDPLAREFLAVLGVAVERAFLGEQQGELS